LFFRIGFLVCSRDLANRMRPTLCWRRCGEQPLFVVGTNLPGRHHSYHAILDIELNVMDDVAGLRIKRSDQGAYLVFTSRSFAARRGR
jgi:hypothetical protein